MVVVSYQILFTDKKDVKKELVLLLKDAFEGNYDEFSEEVLDSLISIKYNKQIDKYKSLVGFDLSFDEIDSEVGSVISDFNDGLKDHGSISLTTKFCDESLLSQFSKIYERIFLIEMELREAVTLIFIDTYKSDYYDLLKDSSIKPGSGKGGMPKNDKEKRDFLEKRLENGFFHISFSQYTGLSGTRDLKQEDLFPMAEMSNNFDEFKKNILNRGISAPHYRAFIEEIKPIMDKLEKIRNCVAHNRSLSEESFDDYEKYFEEIENELELFFGRIKEESKWDGPFTRLWKEGGGDEVANNLRGFKFKKEVLEFYEGVGKEEYFNIERKVTNYLRALDELWGLSFIERSNKISAILVDLKQMPREHQELWYKYLIN